jgi:hypothetical protein
VSVCSAVKTHTELWFSGLLHRIICNLSKQYSVFMFLNHFLVLLFSYSFLSFFLSFLLQRYILPTTYFVQSRAYFFLYLWPDCCLSDKFQAATVTLTTTQPPLKQTLSRRQRSFLLSFYVTLFRLLEISLQLSPLYFFLPNHNIFPGKKNRHTIIQWFFWTFQNQAITLCTTSFGIQKSYMVLTLRLCVLYGPQKKKQRNLPCTT